MTFLLQTCHLRSIWSFISCLKFNSSYYITRSEVNTFEIKAMLWVLQPAVSESNTPCQLSPYEYDIEINCFPLKIICFAAI